MLTPELRPPATLRRAIAVFVACAIALAGAAVAATLTGRALWAAVPAPGCSTDAGAPSAAPYSGRVDAFSVDGRSVLAYLPAGYAAPSDQRFPVVYFLHGSPGAAPDWIGSGAQLPAVLDRMEALGQIPPLIAVFPDGNGADGSWWGNTAHGTAVETWFVAHLVPGVDRRFRTVGAAHRGIAGVSAGGFGALNLATHHPGLFTWVASYSGVFNARPEVFGRDAAVNSPAVAAGALPASLRFPLFVGAGADDWAFRSESDQFISMVEGLRWAPLHTEIVPGPHGWAAWAAEARDSLAWLGRLWSADPALALSMSRSAADRSCP